MLDKYYVGGRILNFDLIDMFALAGTLMVLESLKNLIVYNTVALFSWDVLHFISISLVIITYLLVRWSMRALYIFTLLTLLIGALVPPWLASSHGAATLQIFSGVSAYLIRMAVFVLPTTILFLISLGLPNGRKKINWHILLIFSLILGSAISALIWFTIKDLVFYRIVAETMPLAALFRLPQTAAHLWPLFPWFSLVSAGFILNDLYLRTANKDKWLKGAIALSCAGFLLFYFVAFQDYRDLMVGTHYFSSKVFSASTDVVLGMLSFYAFLFSVLTWIFGKWTLHSKVIYTVSRGLLIFYFVHFILAHFAYRIFASTFNQHESMLYFPWAMVFVSYAIVKLILRFIDRPLLINFRRRT
ncbi:hypothetical protein D3C72_1143370 [compost metagenome]